MNAPRSTATLAPDGIWWPQLTGQPAPSIPRKALEFVRQFDEGGRKKDSEFWLRGKLVGRASWYPNGRPHSAAGVRGNVIHGYQVEYHEKQGSGVSYAEPFVNGKVHGVAKQFDVEGHLLLASPFIHGTGVDYWCDENGRLAEEHPLLKGRPSGCERWWNPNGKSVFRETYYRDGLKHGIAREWAAGKLRPGFPKFFLADKSISRSDYLRARAADALLPPYRREEDRPGRRLPDRFIELRRRALLVRRPEAPMPVRQFSRPVSEEPVVFGRVVAERRYQVGPDFILVQIGTPHRTSWRTDFYCAVRVVGRETKLYRTFGVDSVQALLLAVELARVKLETMPFPVYWEGSERLGDIGIAKRIETCLGVDANERAEELVQRFATSEGRKLARSRKKRRGRAAR